ncbi:aldehyde dehydrogenase family protein [Neptunomonas antarctica]|uniref:Aldehyde dehydrogenase family protein n=1 Tax=Neptunomonas antarctica TaxID=619304 RepID=A0A1N7L7K7_9GAMM|nr:aldehyde dehydrogenase family protein [Neptunomonas antarctica]SIS69796.1 Aldehyde dehydrogenase family protein [Neptunomonas antarctica]
MMLSSYPFYLANKPVHANKELAVLNKYSNEVATYVAIASTQDIDKAIGAADNAKHAIRALPAYKRQTILQHCITRFKKRFE